MRKAVTKYLIINTVFLIVWILIEHVLGFNSTRHDIGQYSRNATMIFFWITIFLAVRETKKNQSGALTFGDGMKAGAALSLTYAFVFAVIIFLYVKLLNPGFYESLRQFTLDQLNARHASQEEIDKQLKEIEQSFSDTPQTYLMLFVFTSVLGIVVSSLAALVYRKR